MESANDRAVAGQAVYTPTTLSVYDAVVLGFSNRYLWKCPSSRIEVHYNTHVSANHLDVGVGTGYFPDRCQFPSDQPRVALMDMNPNTLAFASRRISRYEPETHEQNILEPIEAEIEPFDSIGINYLFHCLPGSIVDKAIAFDHLKTIMRLGGRVFGATILQGGVPRSWAARQLMKVYNTKGIFSNAEDRLEDLQRAMSERFVDVEVEVEGCVALFSGRSE